MHISPRARPRVWPVFLAGLTVWAGACSDTLEPVHRSPHPQDLPVAAADIIPPKSITPQSDAFIRSDGAHKNYGTHDSLLIQRVGNKGAARILVAFPQSGIADSLGADSLVSASLELTIKRTGTDWGTTGRAVAAHRMTRAWIEGGATWSCANDLNLGNNKADCTGNTWTMTGATLPFAAAAVAQSVITNGRTGVVSFDVTGDVRAFLANPAINQGWLLKLAAETQTGTVVFHSKESTTKPRLTLNVYRKSTVPAQAPDTLPLWIYQPENFDSNTPSIQVPFVKNIVAVQFYAGATQVQRQAAVDSVEGTVVGGQRSGPEEGLYYLSVPDTARGAALIAASEELEALPQVDFASYDFKMEPGYRRPNDGAGWNAWHVNRNTLTGDNWALEAVLAPLAWGCDTGSSNVRVAVVDGFGPLAPPTDLSQLSVHRIGALPQAAHPAHGIWVSSIVGATGNNATGMTGVMWAADLDGYEIGDPPTVLRIVARVKDAARSGAPIINLSWQAARGTTEAQQQATGDALAGALRDLRLGAPSRVPLVVIIAGNYNAQARVSGFARVNSGPDSTHVLVVAAMAPDSMLWLNNPTEGSNFGPLVDVAAPGEDVGVLNPNGTVSRLDGTSLAAPVVSGIAGLLLSFDERLSGPDLRDLIKAAADSGGWNVVGADRPYPIANAYWALKLAALRPGAPLCGNRIWASAGNLYASRANGPEALFAPPAGERGAFALAPHHGGRQIDMLAWSGPNLAFTLSGTQWSQSSEVPQIPNNQSGVSNSMWGLSHDGDKEAFIDITAFNSFRILRMMHFSNGASTQTAPDNVLPQLQAYPDTTTIPGIGRGTNDEYMLPWAVAYSPTGDHAVLAVSVHRTTATFNGSEGPCPWSVPDPETGAPSAKCFDSITREMQAVQADLWEYPLPSGQPRHITTLPNTVVGTVAISEDGTHMIINEGMKHEKYDALPSGPEGCSPTQPGVYGYCVEANRTESNATCSVTYRSLTSGAIIAPRIPALYACGLPVGSMSSVVAKSTRRAQSRAPRLQRRTP